MRGVFIFLALSYVVYAEQNTAQVLLGRDDHDLKLHHVSLKKELLGQDGHDQNRHEFLHKKSFNEKKFKKQVLFGKDGHDQKPHKPLLGGDDHDKKAYKYLLKKQHKAKLLLKEQLIGQDEHDRQVHGKLLGSGKHDKVPHGKKALLGSGNHDYKPHGGKKQLLGGGDHDKKSHGKKQLLGGGDHDKKSHFKKQLLGGGDHDKKPHGTQVLLGGDDHDMKHHNKQRLIGGKHDYISKNKLPKKVLARGKHDFYNNDKRAEKYNHLTAFHGFMHQHNRTYNSDKEYKKRFSIFRENMRKIKFLQQNEKGTAVYGVTKFADLTRKEFKKMLGFRPQLKPKKSKLSVASAFSASTPREFDWRKEGVVTPVKNQGMCGSCWAFSTTGNIEGQWAIKHKKLYSLSEQELVDCDTTDSGCNGGLPENAYNAIIALGGLETEADYPYDSKDEECHFNKTKAKVQVTGALELPKDEKALATWLSQNGPISIGINANSLQFYHSGVSHPLKFLCNPDNLDHGVLIVGYGVHTTKYLHRTQPYWLIKNSWGSDWGEEGYFRIYRGDGTCGVNEMATSAVVP